MDLKTIIGPKILSGVRLKKIFFMPFPKDLEDLEIKAGAFIGLKGIIIGLVKLDIVALIIENSR